MTKCSASMVLFSLSFIGLYDRSRQEGHILQRRFIGGLPHFPNPPLAELKTVLILDRIGHSRSDRIVRLASP